MADTNEPIRNRTAGYLLKRYEKNEFAFDWMGMKTSAEFDNGESSQSFKATIRMRRDSVIWISITPALGIEVVRIMITPDTLKLLSKIPDNHYYYIGSVHSLSEKMGIEVEFDMLQNMLIGNAIGLERDEGRFRSEINDNKHLLISRYRRKVRRLVGVDDRKLESDTIILNPDDPKYQRTMRRMDENDEIIVSRYWLEPTNYRLVRSLFNDIVKGRTLEIKHEDFKEEDGQFYPTKTEMRMATPTKTQLLNFEISRISTDRAYEFPFEIPDGYARRDSL